MHGGLAITDTATLLGIFRVVEQLHSGHTLVMLSLHRTRGHPKQSPTLLQQAANTFATGAQGFRLYLLAPL